MSVCTFGRSRLSIPIVSVITEHDQMILKVIWSNLAPNLSQMAANGNKHYSPTIRLCLPINVVIIRTAPRSLWTGCRGPTSLFNRKLHFNKSVHENITEAVVYWPFAQTAQFLADARGWMEEIRPQEMCTENKQVDKSYPGSISILYITKSLRKWWYKLKLCVPIYILLILK